jgi:hypothetical protein
VGSVGAADEWFVLGETTINAVDQGVDIKSQGGRWDKDVKQVKLSVEGADVEITEAVLHWDNRRDDTITDAGVLADGGSTTPRDAPGRKGAAAQEVYRWVDENGAMGIRFQDFVIPFFSDTLCFDADCR